MAGFHAGPIASDYLNVPGSEYFSLKSPTLQVDSETFDKCSVHKGLKHDYFTQLKGHDDGDSF